MTASTLTSQTLIEQYSGFSYNNFMQAGVKMTANQWAAFVTSLIPQVEQWMYKVCNVVTFDPTSALNPITEYQSGSGATNYDSASFDYNPQDICYYLRNLYLNDDTLVIYEDKAPKCNPPAWVKKNIRPTGPLAEIDTLMILSMPTVSDNLTITLNSTFSYNVAVTAGQTIAQVISAIVAAGSQTDLAGITWTPASTASPYITFAASAVGKQSPMIIEPNSTGIVTSVVQTVAGTSSYSGDYEVDTVNGLTKILFCANVPLYGNRNLTFTYNTGYPADSKQYAELQMLSTRACINFLNYKKMEQAAQVIQTSGVEDIVKLWGGLNDKTLGSNGVMEDLDRYKRFPIEGSMFHDQVYASGGYGGSI
jgi:hypothetical protein